jgi:Arc/MetJ-type ribon-helix-helix transcriptional regulator
VISIIDGCVLVSFAKIQSRERISEVASMHYEFSPELEQAIEAKLATGEYASAEELLTDALAALDVIKARHGELRASVQERLSRAGRGFAAPLDVEAFLAEMHRFSRATRPS